MTRLRDALARVDVAGAFSWPTFWLTYALNVIVTFSSVFGADASWWQRIVAVSLAQLAMFGVLGVAARVEALLRNQAVRGAVALAWFALAGATRGAVVGGVFLAWGVASGEGEWPRVMTGVALGLAVLTPMSVVVGNARRYTQARAELLAAREALESTAERIVTDIDDRDGSVLERVRARLIEALAPLDGDASPERLADVADDVVRPLSHELARTAPEVSLRPPPVPNHSARWREVVLASTTGKPFLPLATTTLVALLSVVSIAREIGLATTAMVLPISALLCTYLPLVGANAILDRQLRGRSRPVRFALVIVGAVMAGIAAGVVANVLVVIVDLQLRASSPLVLFRALVLVVPLLALPLALARGAAQSEEASLASLRVVDEELQRRVARLGMVQWAQHRYLARALHGPAQSAIAASARRLQETPEPERAGVIADVRAGLLDLLHPDSSSALAGMSVSWEESLRRIAATWVGLTDVTVDEGVGVSRAMDANSIGREIAVEVLTEAVSNAARHGRATCVRASVHVMGADLAIEVSDDGTVRRSPESGLGTRLLDDCALTWERVSTETGTTLTAVLPLGRM